MPSHILLTGSNGLLGQKVINLLADRLHVELTAVGRGANRHPLREGYTYENLDLTDRDAVTALFERIKPTAVIHTAAMTQVDACEDDRVRCDAVNIDATAHLAQLCSVHGSHMVHISTDFIFDGENGPYKEQDAPNPVNYYGHSKLKAEKAVQDAGISHTILRTILLYGITPGMSRSNIVLWVRSSLLAGKEIKVVNDQFRSPTLAEDLATASVTAAMKQAQGVFHISGPDMMSVVDIARTVGEVYELDTSLISETNSTSLGQKARRPPQTGFIILKAQTELDYKPHTLRQGLLVLKRQMQQLGV
ncbi:MAG: SDR family oxidoreductase [Bacteroidota bacterium]